MHLQTLNALPRSLTSTQQFTRLKGDEVGNWSGLVSYPDDGGMKLPARIGRKRYNAALNHPTHRKRERERVKVNEHECCAMHVLELN